MSERTHHFQKFLAAKFFTFVVLVVFLFVGPAKANESRARLTSDNAKSAKLASDEVLHTPPVDTALYSRAPSELTKKERWKLRYHGLRMAPLDPRHWAFRRIDQTDNRRLVPIRPFYLKESDDGNFRLEQVVIRFRFDPASQHQMLEAPSLHSPLLDLEFNGDFRMGLPGERPPEDSSYVFRLSFSPLYPSGFYYRSHLRSLRLDDAAYSIVSGQIHELKLEVSEKEARVSIDGKRQGRIAGENLSRGLFSLNVDWHPITIESLEVRGSKLGKDGARSAVRVSGLVSVEENQ